MKRKMMINKLYMFQHELDIIKDEMDHAMQNADTMYLSQWRKPTPHMASILECFYDWAWRYETER
jgi:hypothetical protein